MWILKQEWVPKSKDKMTTTKMDQNKNVTCYISVIQIRIYRSPKMI